MKGRVGEKRVVRKFLFWPRNFQTKYTRWLCWVDIVEQVLECDIGGSGQWGEYAYYWREVGFKIK